MYIGHALEPVVRRYSERFKVVMVTGPRQVGKTTVLRHLMEEDVAKGIERSYVTLDNMAVLQAAREDPSRSMERTSSTP